jgi:hypothetical protein
VYFWHSNEIDGVLKIRGGVPAPGKPIYIDVTYPNQNVYGFYANKNFDFGVVRLDAAYRPSREYTTSNYAKYKEGVVKKDFLKAQLGFNKDFMIRSLNPNATFSFIGEYVLDYFPESEMEGIHVATYFVPLHRDSHTIFLSLGTNYNFGMYSYGLTYIHNFQDGGSGLVSPSFTYAPDWMNRKWSFKLAYTAIYGPDYAYPYGLMKEKDLVVLTTQFSFP